MIEYLKYLEENLEIDFHQKAKDDNLLSMILYEEHEDDVAVYDLIDGYLSLCKEVKDEYRDLIDSMGNNTSDSKVSVLMKSIKIDNVKEEDDKYKFTISAERPVPFKLDLSIEEVTYNNEKDDSCVFEKDEYPEYELSFDPIYKGNYRAIVMAGIFNECVDLEDLYYLLKKLYLVNRRLIYTAHAENSLPISIELSNFGEVEVYYSGGNNRESILNINLDNNKLTASDSVDVRDSNDFLANFHYMSSHKNDPIWVLKNIYVNKKDINIPDLLTNLNTSTDILDGIFKKSGYGSSPSYKDMYYDSHKLYYTYGENNELEEITDYESVKCVDGCYKFTFDDDSVVSYPVDKVVVIEEDLDLDREYDSEAVKSLNLEQYPY